MRDAREWTDDELSAFGDFIADVLGEIGVEKQAWSDYVFGCYLTDALGYVGLLDYPDNIGVKPSNEILDRILSYYESGESASSAGEALEDWLAREPLPPNVGA
jgi:hypothetical protein